MTEGRQRGSIPEHIVYVTGMLNGEQPCAHYVASDLSRFGWAQTHCGAIIRFGQGKTLIAIHLAIKFAELCVDCARERVRNAPTPPSQ